ncbi:ATP-binding cassette sub-family A member 2-like [Biomphalaria glabrata]|uniref:ATP-binding cassette sub-family A member 2 n=1 Tax=Biomphalaria glabrata TaxID=6526 RepID=A0A9W3BGC0_BIOGL|nr:ATP-binding cassette sub-family A member 2-like [Biomphalaria glabrata]KAI8730110.1 ATP-binding cassette sub-family A member 2 [Biomphalaria glabrata]
MGFFHQLRLLLWKNFTLKKRSPLVVMFEMFIPLVLFVILLLIRKKLPATKMPIAQYHARALPSTGLLSLIQIFCEGEGEIDQHGFLNFSSENQLGRLLEQLQVVAEDHDFFRPGMSPQEMDELPETYQAVIDDSAFMISALKNASDISFSSVLQDRDRFSHFLISHLNLTLEEAEDFINSTVHVKEIYHYLFGGQLSQKLHITRLRRSLNAKFSSITNNNLSSAIIEEQIQMLLNSYHPDNFGFLDMVLIFQQMLSSAQGNTDYVMKDILPILTTIMNKNNTQSLNQMLLKLLLSSSDDSVENLKTLMELLSFIRNYNESIIIPPEDIVFGLKSLLNSTDLLREILCDNETFVNVLVPENQNSQLRAKLQHNLCLLNKTQLEDLSKELFYQLNTENMIQLMNIKQVNLTATAIKVDIFLNKLTKFIKFQRELDEIAKLISLLPFDENGTDSESFNTSTTWQGNTTDPDSDQVPGDRKKSGWMKMWDFLHRAVCGKKARIVTTTIAPQTKAKGDKHHDKQNDKPKVDEDFLGMTQAQKDKLSIIQHYLYYNPTVLYAPNNSAADRIIDKANTTIAFIDLISTYASEWLNMSQRLHAYLQEEKTARNLDLVKKMQDDIQHHNSFVSWLFHLTHLSPYLHVDIHNSQFYEHQLNLVDRTAHGWLNLMKGINLNIFRGFATEEDMLNYFTTQAFKDNASIIAGVVFQDLLDDGTIPPHLRYKIRQNATYLPSTKQVRKPTWVPGPGRNFFPYYQFGFVWVQDMIERAVIDLQVGRDVVEPGSYIQQFPYPCYVWDQFMFMIEHVMPLCLTFSWVYTVAMLVQSIVYEKEQRLKEVMKMMGLSNAVHWCAWFVTTFVQMTMSVILLTALLKLGNVLPHSNTLIVFLVLEVYICAIISFSFLISVLYSKAKVAAACAGIIYFLSYVPYMYIAIKEDIAGDNISGVWKSMASMFSTTAFGLGAKYFAFYEEMGVGVQWHNIYVSPAEHDEFNLFMVTMMMVLDCFLYAILVWYIEHVHPGSYGLPKPWYFPFMKSYWCGWGNKHVEHCGNPFAHCWPGATDSFSTMEEDQACAMAHHRLENSQRFEPDPVHLPLGVSIDNLSKVYKGAKKTAVKNLSLNLYEGQITSFLGHNGAGKTTTMSMLTGLIPPTAGTASIYGQDIRTDMDIIRQSLGMCPQHNVLFDKFTVEEHLWFFAQLKGMKAADIQSETDKMIGDLGLPDKRHVLVDCLSGGMQRKLSVAIAFVGGSRTVILDEPTAGVDPYARRAIWDLLVKFKKGRTILLSTHHMDEADFLGDRIAIISNGHLKCCGSSIFLKNTIGDGYHLTFSKTEMVVTERGDDEAEAPKGQPLPVSACKESQVTSFIQKYVSSAYLVSENPRELSYVLPFDEVKKGGFEKLFSNLDTALEQLKVSSYGVMDTNLEEIFLKVTEAAFLEEEVSGESKDNDISRSGTNPVSILAPAASNSESLRNLLHLDRSSSCQEPEDQHEQVEMQGGAARSSSVILEDFSGEFAGGDLNMINLASAGDGETLTRQSLKETPRILLEGRGGHMMHPKLLLFNHFKAVIIKRFHYITRNWRSLFSQIILPAIFVAIAMTVALAAPSVDDLPPLELSPVQYTNVSLPHGNFIPFTNERLSRPSSVNPLDADAYRLQASLTLPSGVGSSCLLQFPNISSNFSTEWSDFEHSCQWLVDKYRQMHAEPNFYYFDHWNFSIPYTDSPSYSKVHLYPSNCNCKEDGTGFECERDTYEKPPHWRAITLDTMNNITGQKMQDYLLYTTYDMEMHRYGALSFGLVKHYVPENFGINAPTLFKKLAVRNVATMWFNHKGYHAMGVYLNVLNNAILRANLPESKGNPAAYGITLFNHPWNETNSQLSSLDYILEGSDVLISIFIIAAMSFVPASFVVFLVYERSTKSKHLQFVTGLNPVMYWIGNYVWDMANYVIPAFMCIMILLIFQIPAYVSSSNLPAVVALFLMYGWSMTPLMYPASFWFKEPSTAYIALIVINLFTGITCIVCSFLLEIFSYDHDLERVHNVLKVAFMMFPNYCLGRGLMELAFNEYKNEYYFKTGQFHKIRSAMEWDLIPCHLVAMASIGLIFFIITLMCEYRFFMRPRQGKVTHSSLAGEDKDVATERKRVLKGNGKYDALVLENLTKVYKTRKLGRQLAVDRVCLGVPPGECFGLLGVNGAGKTTTFKMLTGDLEPTSGNAYLNGYSILKDLKKVQQSIGYCPQFDSLYDELTAREHLQLYCRIRGIPPSDETMVVEWAINKLGLTKIADRLSGTYSGGNKRKLSTAIALIGHPPIIFMDEPTTGMDPHSRRFLWDLILGLVQDGRSVILTSHSMEECEALCSRMAIMVNGTFKCLGSATHLKNRFGDGYTFTIRVKGPNYERSRRDVLRFVQRNIPHAELKEEHYNIVQYELKTKPVSLSLLFSKLEEAESNLDIEDYSVSQNTLDNVFINFVQQQSELVHEESQGSYTRPLTSLLRTRASGIQSEADEQLLTSVNQSDDSLDLSDDDILLTLDSIDGNRLTLMPL